MRFPLGVLWDGFGRKWASRLDGVFDRACRRGEKLLLGSFGPRFVNRASRPGGGLDRARRRGEKHLSAPKYAKTVLWPRRRARSSTPSRRKAHFRQKTAPNCCFGFLSKAKTRLSPRRGAQRSISPRRFADFGQIWQIGCLFRCSRLGAVLNRATRLDETLIRDCRPAKVANAPHAVPHRVEPQTPTIEFSPRCGARLGFPSGRNARFRCK